MGGDVLALLWPVLWPALPVMLVPLVAILTRVWMSWVRQLDAVAAELSDASWDPVEGTSASPTPLPSIRDAVARHDLSVVVPAYNEEERLPLFMDEALAYLCKRRDETRGHGDFTFEVIVVDDGSTDGTKDVAARYARKYSGDVVRCLQLRRNCGKGAAVRRGALASRGKFVLFADADGATRFSDVDRLEDAMRSLGSEGVVAGSRAHLQSSAAVARRSALRNFLMHGFHALVRFVAGVRNVKDTQCGFKLFSRDAARMLFENCRLRRWAFDVELFYLAQRLSLPVKEVSVTWNEIPGSKVRMSGIASIALELFTCVVAYSFGIWQIHV